jgi:hypothetical integral membrane protein (TIGR02206 family)
MQVFGVTHILWLLGIAGTSAAMAWVVRRQTIPRLYVRAALAAFLIGGELQRYFHDGMRWPDAMPLNPCNITTWVAVIACLSMAPWAVEYTYFAGFSGAGMALLTPDMGAEWPPRFFVNHGGLIVVASAFIFGRMAQLRPRAIPKAYAIFASFIGFTALFDWMTGTNYAYLRQKPAASVLSYLGPWPLYIFGAGGVALILFSVLWLVAPRRAAEGSPASQSLVPVLESDGAV